MILPAARLWYEGKSKELEDVLQEAETFHLTGYARCVFKGAGPSFIVIRNGAVEDILEVGPGNRPLKRTIRDLWGKSKIKEGLLQVFEIPPEIEYVLARITDRRPAAHGSGMSRFKKDVLAAREKQGQQLLDVLVADGKGLLVIDGQAVTGCWFTENEGLTYTGFDAFRRLSASISAHQAHQLFHSGVAAEPTGGEVPWLAILLGGVEQEAGTESMKQRLAERFGRYYGPGTHLFRDGDSGEEMYLIVSGRVVIFKERGGRRKILAELGPGDFFGEMAIVNHAPRSASAETVENSLLIRIGPEDLQTLLYNSYEFRTTMVRKLAKRLRDTGEEMVKLWEDPRAIYLEKVIYQIMHTDQKWQEEGIPPGVLMQEIANSSGMRFSEIDAVFRKLLDTGKIEFVRGKVVMKEIANLP